MTVFSSVIAVVLAGVVPMAGAGEMADSRGTSRRPNFLLIVADDLGCGDVVCYGCRDIRTPALDKLATQGVRLIQFYANGPECSPTRTALLTGRYQQRIGGLECAIGTGNVGRYDDAIRLADAHDLGLPVRETTIVRLLKSAGYDAAIFGKWHLGYEPKFSPLKHGFDEAFGPLGGGVDYFFHTEPDGTPMLYRNDKRIERDGYLTDLITAEAVRYIGRRRSDRPFLLYVPYTAPHTPIQGSDDRQDKPVPESEWNKGTRATYIRMVERLDEGVGRVLDALRDRGLDRDTVVMFISDNGATRLGSNAPFSGHKGGLMEGGIRVPGIVRWPGVLPAGTTSSQVSITMDLSASIVHLAGATVPQGYKFDGIDLLQRLAAHRPPQRRTLFWRQRRGERTWRAVRDGDLKYVSRQEGQASKEYMFNLARDPGEGKNLLADRPEDAARLKALLAAWEVQVKPAR